MSTWDSRALKTTPVSADEVLIIDTADSRNQKRATLSSIPFGTTSNVGAGEGLALPSVGADFPFKSLIGTAPIVLTGNANDVTFTLNALTNSDLAVGVFSNITGIGTQTQALNMGNNEIINAGIVSLTDTDTSIQQSTANIELDVATNGSQVFRVNNLNEYTFSATQADFIANDLVNVGNLAIGTGVPNSPLHVFEDTSDVGSTIGVTIEQEGTGDAVAQYLLTGGQRWVTGIDNSDDDKYKIASSLDLNSDARLTIDPTTGNVGIGTDTPSHALNVKKSLKVNDSLVFVDDTMQPQAAISDYITGNVATLRFTGKSFDYSNESNDAQAMTMTKDGKRIFLTGLTNPAAPTVDTIIQYDLTTPFDISTATNPVIESTGGNASSIRQITLSPDEKKIYVGSLGLDRIVAFDLTTARDITTLTYNNEFVDTVSGSPLSHYISPDGLRLYVGDNDSDVIREYFMTEVGNLLTASPTGATVSTGAETVPRGVTFTPNGRKMYITGSATDSIIELEMATPWDIANAVVVNTISLTDQNNFVDSVFFRDDMQKMYLVGFTPTSIHEYDMERPSKVATDNIEVFSVNDLPTAVAGTITLPTGNYILKRSLELTDDIEIATNATVTIQSADRPNTTLTFNQGGTFITAPSLGATNLLTIRDITILLGGANAELFDTTGGNLIFNDTTLVFTGTGTKTIGSSATLGNGFIGGSIFQGFNAGWSITSVAQFAILDTNLTSDGTGSGPTINIDALTVLATLNNIGMSVTGSESLFDFVNTITTPIVIDSVTKTGTGDFYTSGALDQTSVNVTTSSSPGSPDSTTTGEFDFLNIASPQLVTISATDTPVAIAGGAWSATELERVTADVGDNGIATITGLGTNKYSVNFSALIEKLTGGATNIALTVLINGTDTTTNPPRSVNAGIIQISGTRLFSLSENDTLQLAAFNTADTNNIEVSQATMSISRSA